jgi:hypothetical protein
LSPPDPWKLNKQVRVAAFNLPPNESRCTCALSSFVSGCVFEEVIFPTRCARWFCDAFSFFCMTQVHACREGGICGGSLERTVSAPPREHMLELLSF